MIPHAPLAPNMVHGLIPTRINSEGYRVPLLKANEASPQYSERLGGLDANGTFQGPDSVPFRFRIYSSINISSESTANYIQI
jgi:hypothetical protein